MARDTDPSLYASNFERMEGDRYWTHPWLTNALIQCVQIPDNIWEPAAGRGDIAHVLSDFGYNVVSSDIDMSEYYGGEAVERVGFVADFLKETSLPTFLDGSQARAIITNPPYNQPRGVAEDFVRHGVKLMQENDCLKFVAMLLRAEFCQASTRKDIFGKCPFYWGEIVLTQRPRWDWWFRDEPIASPRHNFSWFVWSKDALGQPARQIFHYKKKNEPSTSS